jgi:predicted short-subunit dehydrogenase-like oxidoreductase (DUF2520 family)
VDAPLRCGVVGLGRAGGALSASLHLHGARLVFASSRRAERRRAFGSRYPDAICVETVAENLGPALERSRVQVLFLAITDEAVSLVAQALAETDWLPPIVTHLSGAQNHEALHALADRCLIATFHPMAVLDGENPIPTGCVVGIDSDDDGVLQLLSHVARDLGLQPVLRKPESHGAYHAAAVMAANLPVALIDEALALLREAGVEGDVAREGLARLLRSTADAALTRDLSSMLTGPVARGDLQTVATHLKSIGSHPEAAEILPTYRALSRRLVDVARLSEGEAAAMRDLLDEDEG